VAAGSVHTCALLSTGGMECWGNDESGELGNGVAMPATLSLTPVPVPNVSNATAIQASGFSHTCALAGGTWECWGDDSAGELGAVGNSACGCDLTPTSVFPGATVFSTGNSVSCANVSGSVSCIGDSSFGATGMSSALLTGVTSLSSHDEFACAVASGGSVVCWGSNAAGQIGPNGTGSCSGTPCSAAPVTVPGVSNAVSVTTGANFSCALIQGGTVKCWGDNTNGELGNAVTTTCEGSVNPCSTTPMAVAGLTNVTAIAGGDRFACALLQGGTVECWGDNSNNELGNASTATCLTSNLPCSQTPVAVTGLTNPTAIAAGGNHACAVLQSGAVKCWGNNKWAQIGDGTQNGAMTPVSVQF
jgi:alpha-tubulin suppressor-like RCC1 family protein